MSSLSTTEDFSFDETSKLGVSAGEFRVYDIGTPGVPWGEAERQAWRERQVIKRSYQDDVIAPLQQFAAAHNRIAEVVRYGELDYSQIGHGRYDLFAVVPTKLRNDLPTILITGGVHGYETSGVKGAIRFLEENFAAINERANLIVLPCLSPWGYETINRWNPLAIDPNRSFNPDSPGCPEAEHAMNYVRSILASLHIENPLMHIDLHETTDTDNSEFTPAKIARDGKSEPWSAIPEGFYLAVDSEDPALPFQQAMISAVKEVTPIAEPDAAGCIIGEPICSEGIIKFPTKKLFLCSAFTGARFSSTTEVYPDSSSTSPEECIRAQAACVKAGIGYVLGKEI